MKNNDVLIRISLPQPGFLDYRLLSELQKESSNPVLDHASNLFDAAQERMEPLIAAVFVSCDTRKKEHEDDRDTTRYDIAFWRAQDDVKHSPNATHSCILSKNWRGRFRTRDFKAIPFASRVESSAFRDSRATTGLALTGANEANSSKQVDEQSLLDLGTSVTARYTREIEAQTKVSRASTSQSFYRAPDPSRPRYQEVKSLHSKLTQTTDGSRASPHDDSVATSRGPKRYRRPRGGTSTISSGGLGGVQTS